jgi:hypothetical protein
MYNVEIESPEFAGKSLVAQHRMVNQVRGGSCPHFRDHGHGEHGGGTGVNGKSITPLSQILAKEIAEIHGMQLKTRAPST